MRLSNQPCAQCGVDTLHVGLKCSVCETVAVLPSVARDAKLAQIKRRYTDKYGGSKGVMAYQRERHIQDKQAKAGQGLANIGPTRDYSNRMDRSRPARGRERTRC